MSEDTATALDLSGHRLHIVKPFNVSKISTFSVLPFKTDHDCDGSLGFLLESSVTKEKLVFATDTYFIRYKFCGVQYYMVEANYDANILDANIESGLVPSEIKQRLQNSHFEISNVKEFFKKTDLSKCKGIHLVHLSKNNSDKELFEDEIKKITGVPVTAH